MAHFVPVYEALEVAFRSLGGRREGGDDGGGSEGEEARGEKELRGLCMGGLERAGRLRDDVEEILSRGGSGPAVHFAQGSRVEAFADRVCAAAAAEPRLLLAYAWVLYMALFSGGRYIRSRLRGAGAGFWNGGGGGDAGWGDGEGRVWPDGRGGGVDRWLRFWTFEGGEDGEDLKAEFKARFAAVEGTLTEAEKEAVVREAVVVMRLMDGLVVEICDAVGTGVAAPVAGWAVGGERVGGRGDEGAGVRWLLLKHVLPMGLVELIAAGVRSAVGVGMAGWVFWNARAK